MARVKSPYDKAAEVKARQQSCPRCGSEDIWDDEKPGGTVWWCNECGLTWSESDD